MNLTAAEKIVDLGDGVKTPAWTFKGTSSGPAIEACEGDSVKITVANKGTVAHGFDSHALKVDPMHSARSNREKRW